MTPPEIHPSMKDIERLAAQQGPQVQVNPIVTELAGCVPKIDDVEVNGMRLKQILFIHQTGSVAYKVMLPIPMAKDIATRLSAPFGVEIPGNGAV
jgi:hypothetical protein